MPGAFSTSTLKIITNRISHVQCHIINLSLRTVIFQDCLTLARVPISPIPKCGNSTNATIDQYRCYQYRCYRTSHIRCYRYLLKYLKKLFVNSYSHISDILYENQ